jgi:hypothetical protein
VSWCNPAGFERVHLYAQFGERDRDPDVRCRQWAIGAFDACDQMAMLE